MKRNWMVYMTLGWVWLGMVVAMPAASALGLWKTVDEKTHQSRSIVRIWEEGGRLKGRIEKVFLRPGESLTDPCTKCPPPFKGKPSLGMVFLWGFTPDGDRWVDGSVLDPDNGKIYHCELTPAADGKSMRIFGYIRIIFKIGRSQTWLRASEADLQLESK
ncbi:MAG: DUF2147 domain-containing protein [Candidatus Aminicenantes bacterium]|nr:DUF2147 domain-containing protein [Candidatus Aminicenantes bacterium]